MTRLSYDTFMIAMLAIISTAFGCGVMPAGQISTRSFTVSGFTLPVAMAYSTDVVVRNQVSGIAESQERARAIVERLVSQTVFDTLERQGRNALLPDDAISAILGQLTVRTTYEPLLCEKVLLGLTGKGAEMNKKNCIIVDSTVTGLCTEVKNPDMTCDTAKANAVAPIHINHTSISGTLMTTNFIMANWSRAMWQEVVKRAIRILVFGPFRNNFFSATATVGEN
ncbi:hypothetical protein KIN20_016493 [Parelaphostrongylus tenuis]|uniref:Lipoprotein n=1 Tax=Parelaphostrongylus tenuis TaxID=148309 RepID=A0AAD5MZV0_PARTN|nr:hypothetical protein KIN20_016493 [Parelaphostrongylus tenuis]